VSVILVFQLKFLDVSSMQDQENDDGNGERDTRLKLAGIGYSNTGSTYTEPRTTGRVMLLPASVGFWQTPVLSFGPHVFLGARGLASSVDAARAITRLGSCLGARKSSPSTGAGRGCGFG
jgi:hypothetical protein